MLRARFPVKLEDAPPQALRSIVDRAPVQIPDVEADPTYLFKEGARQVGFRSIMSVPLLLDGQAIGTIAVARRTPGLFPDAAVELLQTFARQAVIAIENVRLFNETKEALEQQTATAEVLQVISQSVADTAPVFEKILQSCEKLFGVDYANVALIRDDGYAPDPGLRARFDRRTTHGDPARIHRTSPAGTRLDARLRHSQGPVSLPGAIHGPDVPKGLRAEANGPLATMPPCSCPDVLGGQGHRHDWRTGAPARPFSDKEIGLLRTFADQAVIAIQNARLFNETQEALEKQTATSEILRAISRSPTSTAPVFQAIAERAMGLCRAEYGFVFTFDGEWIRMGCSVGISDAYLQGIASYFPMRPGGHSVTARTIATAAVVNVADVLALAGNQLADAARTANFRAALGVPMLREGQAIGAIVVGRAAVGEFGGQEVELLTTFADQAVIAIENVRLFNETKEALEQQTATAEVLEVISNSVADAQPVFDKILDSCQRLIDCTDLSVMTVDEQSMVHLGSVRGDGGSQFQKFRPTPVEQTVIAEAMRERRVMSYPDALHGGGVPEVIRRMAAKIGNFSLIIAPMVWQDRGVGALFVARLSLQAFTAKEMALLEMFADQAAIAIQNAALFHEAQEARAAAETANDAKSSFLATMSHEIRRR